MLLRSLSSFATSAIPARPSAKIRSLTATLAFAAAVGGFLPGKALADKFDSDSEGVIWEGSLSKPKGNGFAGYVTAIGGGNLDQGTTGFRGERGSSNGFFPLYTTDCFTTQTYFTTVRTSQKVPNPRIRSNYQLGVAAQFLVEEMLRQGWLGLNFPDGKNIAWALKKADYQGDYSKVQGFVFNSFRRDDVLKNELNRDMMIKAYPMILNNWLSYGYGGTNVKTDGSVNPEARNGRIKLGYLQAFLFSTEPTAEESRAVFADKQASNYLRALLFKPTSSLALTFQVGQNASGGVVTNAAQLKGRPTITGGRLPKGVRLVKGFFVGQPKRPGVYRFTVRGTFKTIDRGAGPEGRQGDQQIKTIIRVRN